MKNNKIGNFEILKINKDNSCYLRIHRGWSNEKFDNYKPRKYKNKGEF